MSLLGKTEATGPAAMTEGDETFKAKKLAALKKWKQKKDDAAKAAYANALRLRDALKANGSFDKLTQADKDFVISLCRDPAERKVSSGGGSPVLNMLFGENPKVGAKITLEQAFNKTAKGKSTLDIWVRRQAEKGIEIDIVANANIMMTEYVIKKLPA